MRLFKLLTVMAVTACLSASPVFAGSAEGLAVNPGPGHNKCVDFGKDPLKALECRKEKVKALQKEGRITKAEADEMIARIDAKIARVKEFEKLTVPQKKAKLVEDFRAAIGGKVKAGKLTQERADAMIREFTEEVDKWDGKGYPRLPGKWFRGDRRHPQDKPAEP